jgi:hypothetical protein
MAWVIGLCVGGSATFDVEKLLKCLLGREPDIDCEPTPPPTEPPPTEPPTPPPTPIPDGYDCNFYGGVPCVRVPKSGGLPFADEATCLVQCGAPIEAVSLVGPKKGPNPFFFGENFPTPAPAARLLGGSTSEESQRRLQAIPPITPIGVPGPLSMILGPKRNWIGIEKYTRLGLFIGSVGALPTPILETLWFAYKDKPWEEPGVRPGAGYPWNVPGAPTDHFPVGSCENAPGFFQRCELENNGRPTVFPHMAYVISQDYIPFPGYNAWSVGFGIYVNHPLGDEYPGWWFSHATQLANINQGHYIDLRGKDCVMRGALYRVAPSMRWGFPNVAIYQVGSTLDCRTGIRWRAVPLGPVPTPKPTGVATQQEAQASAADNLCLKYAATSTNGTDLNFGLRQIGPVPRLQATIEANFQQYSFYEWHGNSTKIAILIQLELDANMDSCASECFTSDVLCIGFTYTLVGLTSNCTLYKSTEMPAPLDVFDTSFFDGLTEATSSTTWWRNAVPPCTPIFGDPYAQGLQHLECCSPLKECNNVWHFDASTVSSFKCMPTSAGSDPCSPPFTASTLQSLPDASPLLTGFGQDRWRGYHGWDCNNNLREGPYAVLSAQDCVDRILDNRSEDIFGIVTDSSQTMCWLMCTPQNANPWATTVFVQCCFGWTSCIGDWDGSGKHSHRCVKECIPPKANQVIQGEECAPEESDPCEGGSCKECCPGLRMCQTWNSQGPYHVCLETCPKFYAPQTFTGQDVQTGCVANSGYTTWVWESAGSQSLGLPVQEAGHCNAFPNTALACPKIEAGVGPGTYKVLRKFPRMLLLGTEYLGSWCCGKCLSAGHQGCVGWGIRQDPMDTNYGRCILFNDTASWGRNNEWSISSPLAQVFRAHPESPLDKPTEEVCRVEDHCQQGFVPHIIGVCGSCTCKLDFFGDTTKSMAASSKYVPRSMDAQLTDHGIYSPDLCNSICAMRNITSSGSLYPCLYWTWNATNSTCFTIYGFAHKEPVSRGEVSVAGINPARVHVLERENNHFQFPGMAFAPSTEDPTFGVDEVQWDCGFDALQCQTTCIRSANCTFWTFENHSDEIPRCRLKSGASALHPGDSALTDPAALTDLLYPDDHATSGVVTLGCLRHSDCPQKYSCNYPGVADFFDGTPGFCLKCGLLGQACCPDDTFHGNEWCQDLPGVLCRWPPGNFTGGTCKHVDDDVDLIETGNTTTLPYTSKSISLSCPVQVAMLSFILLFDSIRRR